MSMNFDTYSTSFQSLMSPMYNLSTNYNVDLNGNGGMGAYGGGYGGYSGGGFMGPMMNVGVGQFNADYLVKGDEARNNYYTRPVAVHKTKNDVPMMLGIAGAALGTVALLVALCKGRGSAAAKESKNISKFLKGGKDEIKYTVPPRTVSRKHTRKPAAPPVEPWKPAPFVAKPRRRPTPNPIGSSTPFTATASTTASTTAAASTASTASTASASASTAATAPVVTASTASTASSATSPVVTATTAPTVTIPPVVTTTSAAVVPPTIATTTAVTPNLPAPIYKFDGIEEARMAASGYAPLDKEALKQVVFGQQNRFMLPEGTIKFNNNVKPIDIAPYKNFQDGIISRKVADNLANNGLNRFAQEQNPLVTGILQPAKNRRFVQEITPLTVEQAKQIRKPVIPQEPSVQVTRKGNRYPSITGGTINGRLNQLGLQLDGNEFAKLYKHHRELNNIFLNGTDAQIKNLALDPRFEKAFKQCTDLV